MHYLAGWTPCTQDEILIRNLILAGAFIVLVSSSYFILKRLGGRGVGLLLSFILIAAVATVLYFVAGLSIFHFLGFCSS